VLGSAADALGVAYNNVRPEVQSAALPVKVRWDACLDTLHLQLCASEFAAVAAERCTACQGALGLVAWIRPTYNCLLVNLLLFPQSAALPVKVRCGVYLIC
jgi:hypothetical protein